MATARTGSPDRFEQDFLVGDAHALPAADDHKQLVGVVVMREKI
jgi:CBS-domain-containing membrane protein